MAEPGPVIPGDLAQLRAIFDQAPAMIALHEGPDHVHLYVNPAQQAAAMGRELLGRPLREAVPELRHQGVFERYDRVLETGEPMVQRSFPVRLTDPDTGQATTRFFTQTLQPWRDSEGAIRGVMSFGFEVTAEVTLRKQVQESERRLHVAKKAAGLGVFDWDVASGAIHWDERVRSLWGIPPEEPIDFETFRAGLLPEDRPPMEAAVDRSFDPEGNGHFDAEYRVRNRRDGDVRWIYATGQVTFEDRVPVRMIGTVEDITDVKRAQAELRASQTKLREAGRRKDEFIAMLGHELRNPLAAIRNACELLERSALEDPRLRRASAILERQTAHMAKLLDGLLDVSRIIGGKIRLERELLDVRSVCGEVVADLRERHPLRIADLTAETPDEPVWVEGDRVRLVQIVDNLLSNAMKYSSQGDAVELTLAEEDGEALLEIRDAGMGIEPELLPQVFEVFSQSQQTIDRSSGGLGLGLALAQSLVELHGGDIEASSEGPGQGARFTVRLPLAARPALEAQADAPPEDGSLDVLIVEDNADAAEMLKLLLELDGHAVSVATHGDAGIAMATQRRSDVVLCDLSLPGGPDGFEVARTLRADESMRRVRLVALSGFGRAEDRNRAQAAGFDAYVTKPIDLGTFNRVLVDLGLRARGDPGA